MTPSPFVAQAACEFPKGMSVSVLGLGMIVAVTVQELVWVGRAATATVWPPEAIPKQGILALPIHVWHTRPDNG